jgi:hypothetical protein
MQTCDALHIGTCAIDPVLGTSLSPIRWCRHQVQLGQASSWDEAGCDWSFLQSRVDVGPLGDQLPCYQDQTSMSLPETSVP